MADTYQMFIGGKWVNRASARRARHEPGDRGGARRGPGRVRRGRRPRRRRGRAAFDETWMDATPGRRQAALLKLAEIVEEHGEEFGKLESEERGQAVRGHDVEEVPVIADQFRFFAGGARFLEGRSTGEYMKGFTSMIRREPIGIAGLIAMEPPVVAWKMGPALAAGNCVVIKPSELTPLAAEVRALRRRGRGLPARRVQRRDGRRRRSASGSSPTRTSGSSRSPARPRPAS